MVRSRSDEAGGGGGWRQAGTGGLPLTEGSECGNAVLWWWRWSGRWRAVNTAGREQERCQELL